MLLNVKPLLKREKLSQNDTNYPLDLYNVWKRRKN